MNRDSLAMLQGKVTQLVQTIDLNSRVIEGDIICLNQNQLSELQFNSEFLRLVADYWHRNLVLIRLEDFQQLFEDQTFWGFRMEFSNKAQDIGNILNSATGDLNLVLRLPEEQKANLHCMIKDKLKVAVDLIATLNEFVCQKIITAHHEKISELMSAEQTREGEEGSQI